MLSQTLIYLHIEIYIRLDVQGQGGGKILDVDGQGEWEALKIRQFSRTSYVYRPLGLRMLNFQGIIFIRTRTYKKIFKSALVYL